MTAKKSTRKITLDFSILADLLSDQLDDQGLTYDKKKVAQLQNKLHAVQQLSTRPEILTTTQTNVCYQKIRKHLLNHICEQNNAKITT